MPVMALTRHHWRNGRIRFRSLVPSATQASRWAWVAVWRVDPLAWSDCRKRETRMSSRRRQASWDSVRLTSTPWSISAIAGPVARQGVWAVCVSVGQNQSIFCRPSLA